MVVANLLGYVKPVKFTQVAFRQVKCYISLGMSFIHVGPMSLFRC